MTVVNTADEPDEIGRRLIDEAGRLLAEHGPDGVSLRRVAQAAGTSTMSVYTRFGSKQLLLGAMYREGFRRLGAELASASGGTATDLTALAETGRAYRRAALASPALYGLMFGALPEGLEISEDDAAAAWATFVPLLDGVRAGIEAGVIAGDAERVAQHLWSVAHGTVGLELAGMLGEGDPEQRYDEALGFAIMPFLAGEAPS